MNNSERVISRYERQVQGIMLRFWKKNRAQHGVVDWRERERRYARLYEVTLAGVWTGVMQDAKRLKVGRKLMDAEDYFEEWVHSYAPVLAGQLANVDKKGLEAAMRLYTEDPATAEQLLRDSVSLLPSQVSGLGARAAKARAAGYGADALEESLSRWTFEALNYRAKMIGVTEINRGFINGQEAAIKAGVEGNLLPDNIVKTWSTAADELVCDVCGPMDKESVALNDDFDIEGGKPPAHPWCRCTINYGVEK